MGIYSDVILPKLSDLSMRNESRPPYRERVVGAAEGRFLEMGSGSGLNLTFYRASPQEVLALEPDPALSRWPTASRIRRCRSLSWRRLTAACLEA
ncbi:hypothetical protein D9M68_456210 [compost metagenome]